MRYLSPLTVALVVIFMVLVGLAIFTQVLRQQPITSQVMN